MDNALAYGRISTIELIRRELCSHGIGALVETSVRQLARAIGRSCGQISVHLNQLEEDGWIRRISESAGTVVEVVRTDHAHDRSFTASQSDHADDRVSPSDHPALMPNPARSAAESGVESDHETDPPCIPNMVLSMTQEQQQLRAPLWDALITAGAAASVAQEILDKNPELTLAAFETLCRAAGTRGSRKSEKSIGLVFWCLQNNQPLHSAKESSNARPQQRRPAPNRPERSASPQPPSLQPGDLARYPKRGALPGVSG